MKKLFLFIFLLAPMKVHAAWQEVQVSTNHHTDSSNLNIVSTQSVSANNLLTMQLSNNGGALLSIIDSAGDTWVVDSTGTNAGHQLTFLAHATALSNVVLSATATFASTSYPTASLMEFSYTPGVVSVSSATNGSATSTSVNIGSVTFSNLSALVIQSVGVSVAETFTPGTYFTAGPFVPDNAGVNYGNYVQFQTGPNSSPVNCQATISGSTAWSSACAAYQSSGDVAPSAPSVFTILR